MDDLDRDLALPRAAVLALWLAYAPHEPGAVTAVQDDDEPHTVSAPDLDPAVNDLPALLRTWAPVDRCVALLPEPGDVTGVPADVTSAAVDAGECLLVSARGRWWAAVPEVTGFGSAHEPGHLVRWDVVEVDDWTLRVPGALGTLAEAERTLRESLTTAAEALTSLDVARWRPDAAAALQLLRSGDVPGWVLPTSTPVRAVRVLAQAARLRAIVALATGDDGGAVNLWQADQRTAALRHVDHAARRAAAAATHGPGPWAG